MKRSLLILFLNEEGTPTPPPPTEPILTDDGQLLLSDNATPIYEG